MAEPGSRSHMRTRSQTRSKSSVEEFSESGDRVDGGGLVDTSAPPDNSENLQQQGRSSVNIRPPVEFQTQPLELCSADISEPVLKVTDRRIRSLLAKTTTNKMLLNSHIEELRKMAKRHEEYQKAGEEAEMLVDIAHTIKQKLKETERLEKQLIAEFGSLTLLLEMLNLDGEEEDRKKGTEMSNKVNADLVQRPSQ